MKRLRLTGAILSLLCLLCLSGCKEDGAAPSTPFELSVTHYEVQLANATSIYITNGSGSLDISVADSSVATATYTADPSTDRYFGYVNISGKKKGTTTIVLTDKGRGESQTLTVKVVEGYVSVTAGTSNHPAVKAGMSIFFISNAAHDCYFFKEDGENLTLAARGTYDFSVERVGEPGKEVNVPYMTLSYPTADDGNFTDAAVAPTAHKFNLAGSSGSVFSVLHVVLGVTWNQQLLQTPSQASRDLPPVALLFVMSEDGTNYKTEGDLLISTQIPENIL